MTPPPRTSSCNPDRLGQYAADSLEMSNALEDVAQGADAASLTQALSRLASAGGDSQFVPAMGTIAEDFADLAGDWRHLDEFAGDVAAGFRQAAVRDGRPTNSVFELPDSDIGQLGQVGYADRDEAIADAEAMAAELERLIASGDATVDEVLAFANMAERGQFDPAFAVAFSEAVGVDGYADATALIRTAYEGDENGPFVGPEGIAAVGILAQTMTTALDTLPGVPRGERHDPDNADLFDADRLGPDFVLDLTSGYQKAEASLEDRLDMSVLLGMTDPPTGVAVEIANHRMTPELVDQLDERLYPTEAMAWGEHSGIVTNYAEMLGRNQDASTLWLNTRGVDANGRRVDVNNIELVLQRPNELDREVVRDHQVVEGGDALAQVIANGLTNPDLTASELGGGRPVRELLMEQAIELIGEQEEIRNDYMHAALAHGVESNMGVIDDYVNAPSYSLPGQVPDHVEQSYLNTERFLREVSRDPDAALRLRSAVYEYGMAETANAPETGETRDARLKDLGRIQTFLDVAQDNALTGAAIDEIRAAEESALGDTTGDVADFGIGLVPYAGDFNDIADAMGASTGDGIDWLLGQLGVEDPTAFDSLTEAEQLDRTRQAQSNVNQAVWLAVDRFDTDPAFREEARGQPFVDENGALKSHLAPDEAQAFREWATSMVGTRGDPGPLGPDEDQLDAGSDEVRRPEHGIEIEDRP